MALGGTRLGAILRRNIAVAISHRLQNFILTLRILHAGAIKSLIGQGPRIDLIVADGLLEGGVSLAGHVASSLRDVQRVWVEVVLLLPHWLLLLLVRLFEVVVEMLGLLR